MVVRKRGDVKKAVEEVLSIAALEGRASLNGGPNGTMQIAEIRAEIKILKGWEPLAAAVQNVLKRGSTGPNTIFEKVDKDGFTITGGHHGFWRIRRESDSAS